jgi:TRAP-type uncharacterized transport system fused permease subunit
MEEPIDFSNRMKNIRTPSQQTDSVGVARQSLSTRKRPSIIDIVMRYGGKYVADEKQATHILIVFVVIAIFFSLYLFKNKTDMSERYTSEDTRDIILQMEQ